MSALERAIQGMPGPEFATQTHDIDEEYKDNSAEYAMEDHGADEDSRDGTTDFAEHIGDIVDQNVQDNVDLQDTELHDEHVIVDTVGDMNIVEHSSNVPIRQSIRVKHPSI